MTLEAEGVITIRHAETGALVCQYEGLAVHQAMEERDAHDPIAFTDCEPDADQPVLVWVAPISDWIIVTWNESKNRWVWAGTWTHWLPLPPAPEIAP